MDLNRLIKLANEFELTLEVAEFMKFLGALANIKNQLFKHIKPIDRSIDPAIDILKSVDAGVKLRVMRELIEAGMMSEDNYLKHKFGIYKFVKEKDVAQTLIDVAKIISKNEDDGLIKKIDSSFIIRNITMALDYIRTNVI